MRFLIVWAIDTAAVIGGYLVGYEISGNAIGGIVGTILVAGYGVACYWDGVTR